MPDPTPVLRTAALFVLVLAGASAALARPAGTPDPTNPDLTGVERLEALVERVKLEQKQLRTLEADFVQERESEFLEQPERSLGTFSYQHPDKVRWEYREPRPISLVIDDDQMTTWYRDLGRAERVQVGRVSTQVFQYLNASGSLESLLGYFSVAYVTPKPGQPWRLELRPRYPRIAKKLSSMTLWIDPQSYLPTRVRYVEANGDTTEYRLERMRANGEIPAERFDLELPQDVEVREVNLGGAGSGNSK